MLNKKVFLTAVGFVLIIILGWIYFTAPPVSKPSVKIKRIAIFTASDLQLAGVDGIKAGLKDLGYTENKDVSFTIYNPQGNKDVAPKMAQDVIDSKPDLIVALSTSASALIKNANTAAIPTVAADIGNFKDLGIENIQHPGGFMTAVVVDNISVAPKRMEILKTLLPNLKQLGVLSDPKHISYQQIRSVYEDGAKKLGITLVWREISKKEEIPSVVKNMITSSGIQAFITVAQPLISDNSNLVADVLKSYKIPSIDHNAEKGIKAGYLMVYGVSRFDTGKQTARVIDKVLKGQSPGDIPVEFAATPTFEINGALAKLFGIVIPEKLLLEANKIDNQ